MIEEKWLKEYDHNKSKLRPLHDLNSYFNSEEINGIKLDKLCIGDITIPTGKIMAFDPLVSYDKEYATYIQEVPVGKFPLTISVAILEDWGEKYAGVMVEFSDKIAIRYEQGLTGSEDLKDLEEGDYFGFFVDAGLATIMDSKTNEAYCEFIDKWYKENPDGEIYDDLFYDLFENSYSNNPKYQREVGDWIMWQIPDTEFVVPMFASGFGDGVYPVYFGYDEDDNVCNIIIHFIDLINEV